MSSAQEAIVEIIKLNNYMSLMLITAVVYDYTLNLPKEIDYVWCRRWTLVSTLYVLARYLGLFLVIRFLLSVQFNKSTSIYLASSWVAPVFLAASELIMILRVYAMWNRSKIVLAVLLFAYVPQVVLAVVPAILVKDHYSITLSKFLDFFFCSADLPIPFLDPFTLIPRVVLSILLLVLSVSQTLRESIRMYKATRRWQSNRYMKIFVRDGMLFFILSMLTYTAFLPQDTFSVAKNTSTIFLRWVGNLYYGPFIPHMIINLRELYDRDVRGRALGIDTGFGMLSQPTSGGNLAMSTIVFADAAPLGLRTEGDVDD